MKNTALTSTALGLIPGFSGQAFAGSGNGRPVPDPFVGIQLGTHSLLYEGIEWSLDHMKEKGEIDTLITYSHSYYGAFNRPDEVLADHGKGIVSYKDRNLPKVWVNHNDAYFKGLLLKHEKPSDTYDFYGRDAFNEMRKPLDERGMKVYVRLFEAWGRHGIGRIENYEKVQTVDIDGNMGEGPCWNNPDYQLWMFATVKDIFTHYRIDGIQYGAERVGPLSELLFKGQKPNCFCEHCIKKNQDKGVDPGRAKEGFRELQALVHKAQNNKIPADGVLVSIMGVIFRYPEILSWERNFYDGGEQINRGIYNTVKSIDQDIQVGRHIDHQQSSWDPLYRGMVPYSSMVDYNDFIKPILYPEILSLRLKHWYINKIINYVGRDYTEKELLDGFYALMRYPNEAEIPWDKMEEVGMPPAYVFRETERCLAGVSGKAEVYPGVGFDVPWHLPEGGMRALSADPKIVYEATMAAFKAGAHGVVASRDYDEMQNESLEAFGNAVRDWKKQYQ